MSYEMVQETAFNYFGENITVVYAPEKVCWIVESWPSGGIVGFVTWMNGHINVWSVVHRGTAISDIGCDAAGGESSTNMLDQLLFELGGLNDADR